MDRENNEKDNIMICFVESFEIIKIVKRLNRQKTRCLFHIRFDFRFTVPSF